MREKTWERRLRNRRASYNAAIAARDADAIASHLTDDYEVTTSAGQTRKGRDASRDSWRARFEADPSINFVRTPTTFDVDGDSAKETGTWVGAHAIACGTRETRGTYTAEWRKADGRWLVAVERFSPTE